MTLFGVFDFHCVSIVYVLCIVCWASSIVVVITNLRFYHLYPLCFCSDPQKMIAMFTRYSAADAPSYRTKKQFSPQRTKQIHLMVGYLFVGRKCPTTKATGLAIGTRQNESSFYCDAILFINSQGSGDWKKRWKRR